MTSRVSKLALVAVLAGSVPALAAANDRGCDGDHDGRPVPVVVTAPVYTPPPPAYAPPGRYPAPPPAWREGFRDRRGHELGWRERELAAIRADLARLDAERADFRAHNAWRPGKLRRYDRWYFERRAELERREHELARFAWR
jgi:aminoglycoside phosphotransferase (APT) family kinase protein